MEDEQGDLGPVSIVTLPNETLEVNMKNENKVEESIENEEEVAVEVVGSDVLVDGISGYKEGGAVNEAVAVSSATMVESVIEKNEEVVSSATMVESEEKVVEHEVIDRANCVTSELVNASVQNFVVKEVGSAAEILENSVVVGREVSFKSTGEDLDTSGVDGKEVGLVDSIKVLSVAHNEVGSSEGGMFSTNPEISNPTEHDQMEWSPISTSEFVPETCGEGKVLTEGEGKVFDEKEILADEKEILAVEKETNVVVQDESTDILKDGVFSGGAKNETLDNGDAGLDEKDGDGKEVLFAETKDLVLDDVAKCGNAESETPNNGGDAKVDKIEVPAAETEDLILNRDIEENMQDSMKKVSGEVSEATPESIRERLFVGEGGEPRGIDLDQAVDLNDEESDVNNFSSTVKDESLGTGVDLHTEIHKDKDQEIAISQVKALDEDDELGESIENFDAETVAEHQEAVKSVTLDTSSETISFREKDECSKVDVVLADNHVVNAVVGLQSPVEELFVQKTEIPNLGTDENEGIYVIPDKVPELTEKPELDVSSTNISSLDGLSQIKEHEVSVQEMELQNLGADKIERSIQNEVSELTEKPEVNVSGTNISALDDIMEDYTSDTKLMDVEVDIEFDQDFDQGMEIDSREQDLGTEELVFESENFKFPNEVKSVSSLRMNQSGYFSPSENEGQFEVSDLVWGKVRSHPWWPGQIFDTEDASEKAVKYQKKDSYLVAYFGDRTFAWNDASLLKPFRSNFSQIEKQSNSELFQNAVTSALEEVSRRVQLGLVCSCVPKDAYNKIEIQVVENTGICEESSRRCGVDKSSQAANFEPGKLIEYVKNLATSASYGADRLDLVIARAQLTAFCRFKGYRMPAEFPLNRELLENDAEVEQKRIPKGSSNKERSMTEIMGDMEFSPDDEENSNKKRKAVDSLGAEMLDKRVHVHAAKVSQTPKPSFKIGECIRRVASQLTGSTSIIKGHNDEIGNEISPVEPSSLSDMLSQLQLLAQEPKNRHNSLSRIVPFFSDFRSSIVVNKRGRKKKSDKTITGSGEEFEFDDVNDSYWTDRIVQNYSGEQLLHNIQNGASNHQLVSFSAVKSAKPGRKPHSRKRYFSGDFPGASVEIDEKVKRRKQESSPAELILSFSERNCVPSEINLNKMFRRFGTLMESETEVDHDSGRAKVIFKRGSDAEVAHDSAEKFKIFGPVLVDYQIGYSPLISVKVLPLAVPQFQQDATLMM